MTYQAKEEDDINVEVHAYAGDDKEVVMENDYLKFVMDPLTTNFDITVKSSGKVWHSVPEDAADDPIAIVTEKNKIQSSFLLVYSNDAGLDVTLDSYSFSALNGIYEIEQGEDYVRVDYSLGKVAKEYIIPPVITEEKQRRNPSG